MRTKAIAILLAAAALPLPALAAPAGEATLARASAIPTQLDAAQRDGYAKVFAALRDSRWAEAQAALDALPAGPLHPYLRAELFTARGSPRVELQPLVDLIVAAPDLPQAAALVRLAKTRGATELPELPTARPLIWQDGAPIRVRTRPTAGDAVAASMAAAMQPFVKTDDGPAAEALLTATTGLGAEATTEWQARVAWIYFLMGRDADTRRLGALAQNGAGDWAVQARWMTGLAAWRQNDFAAAASAFEAVAAQAGDVDLRATALYWAARADTAGGRPDRVEARLKSAAQWPESFYGQLARQTLGLRAGVPPTGGLTATDWTLLARRPNIRAAAALAELGESDLADKLVRQQARIGNPAEFAGLIRLAEALDLPATAVWLAHNCPQGVTAGADARYPAPSWRPDSGWRVDRSLVFAHALQESGFRPRVVSPAGAYGLMQIMPAAATDFARERGLPAMDRSALTRPATNMDVGQRHLERLRDMTQTTGGLLPKVIAAYNAGPAPVGQWNTLVRDGGDPLLYIESIPYWETRGYVVTVLRNYWMYEAQTGRAASPSRAALAQGMWPRFPGMSGPAAVRMTTTAVASVGGRTSGTD